MATEQRDDNQFWFDSQTPERTARTRGIRRVLIVVLLLNVLVALVKLGYGLLTESVSMTADGAQSMLDGLSNVIGLVSIAVAARPPDEEHHYGHDRYETLASLIIAMMMVISALEISRIAVGQLLSGNSPTVNAGSFVVLVCTMIVNLWVSWWENRKGRELKSDFLTADSRHTLSDVVVSSGVILGLLAVQAGYGRADGYHFHRHCGHYRVDCVDHPSGCLTRSHRRCANRSPDPDGSNPAY